MSISSAKRLGSTPVALTTAAANVYNPASGVFGVIKSIHVVNKTGGAVTFSLWLGPTGATGAGTEEWNGQSVPANSTFDWFGNLQLGSSDFLVGLASANTSLSITLMGEEYLQPPTS